MLESRSNERTNERVPGAPERIEESNRTDHIDIDPIGELANHSLALWTSI